MTYPNEPFSLTISFTDLNDTEWKYTLQFENSGDDWRGVNIDEKTAFEANAFEVEGRLWVNVYQLDPEMKRDGLWTLDKMTELKVSHFFIPSPTLNS